MVKSRFCWYPFFCRNFGSLIFSAIFCHVLVDIFVNFLLVTSSTSRVNDIRCKSFEIF